MNKELAKELVKARKSIREKYQSLKSDISHSQSQLEKKYKPITESLNKLLSNPSIHIKQEPAEIKTETPLSIKKRPSVNPYSQYALPMGMPSFLEDTFQYNAANDDYTEQDSDDLINQEVEKSRQFIQDLSSTKAYEDYLEAYDPLPREYIDISVRGNENENDRQYGVKHDISAEKLSIGDSELHIVGKDVKVGGVTYIGTPGLYELLFKKHPIGYKSSDLENYMDILKRANAYRRNLDPNDQIQGSQSEKYRTILKPYLTKKGIIKSTSTISRAFSKPPPPTRPLRRTQSLKLPSKGGLLNLSKNKIDYVWFNNPNELVDRLRLLLASQMAGNNAHHNEIVSIIEELREAKIIK